MPDETVDYQLRKIPADLWKEARHTAIEESISMRELIIRAVRDYIK